MQDVKYNLAINVLENIFSGASQLYIYKKIHLFQEGEEFILEGSEDYELVLVGNGFELYLIALEKDSFSYQLLWQKRPKDVLQMRKKEKIPRDGLVISGIHILGSSAEVNEVEVTISGDIFHNFSQHFQLLLLHSAGEVS